MTGKQVVRTLFALAICTLFGASLAAAEPALAPAVQPAVSAPLPAFLTAPAGEECAAEPDVLSGVTTNECGEGCSFESFNYCSQVCCGGWGSCIDTMDGGYCLC